MIEQSIVGLKSDPESNFCFILAILDFIKEKNNDDYLEVLRKVSQYSKGMFMDRLESLPVDQQQRVLDLIKEK